MKALYVVGLTVFGLGIILFFLKEFNVALVQHIDESLIDIIWAIGMIIYGIAMIFMNAQKRRLLKSELL